MRRQDLLTRLGGRSREPGPAQRAARLMMVALLLLPQVALPATITVDGTGSETTTNGVCSIREAINNANNDDAGFADCTAGSGADTIELSNTVSLTDVDHDDRGLPLITSDITIEGGGFSIERNIGFGIEDFAILRVISGGTLSINDTTVANGATPDGIGGGIWNNGGVLNMTNTTVSNNSAYIGGGMCTDLGGTATVVDCAITDNYAAFAGGVIISDYSEGYVYSSATFTNSTISGNEASANGGGLYVQVYAETTLTDSTVSGNTAAGSVGGIVAFRSDVALTNSTVSGNTTPGTAGGIASVVYSNVTVTNSTLSGNYGQWGGGGYTTYGATMTLVNSTVAGNEETSGGGGGGLYNYYYPGNPVLSTMDLANTIVADNIGGDCGGNDTVVDSGNNFSSDGTCPGTEDLIIPGVDFDTTLADNGGPTETHALLDGSVAIEAALNCGQATDQRGEPRCFACDSGSYELLVDVDAGCDCILLDGPSKVFVDQEFELNMSCANPDSRVLVTAGRDGNGSVRVVPGCGPVQFGVGPRANNFGATVADSEGNATSSQTLGSSFGNETIYYEVLDLSKCEVSTVRSIFVNKAPDAPNMSGLGGRAAAARQRISGSSNLREMRRISGDSYGRFRTRPDGK